MTESDYLRTVRTGAYLALGIYGIFGILDLLMLPDHFKTAWLIRYALLVPVAGLCLILSYHKNAEKLSSLLITILLFFGQTGILMMIAISSPDEPAFYGYYVGMILMILACEFIFRLPLRATFIFFVLSISAYALIAVFIQNILDERRVAAGESWLVGNLFFMTFAGIISMMGTDRIHKENRISEQAKLQAEQANRMKSSFLANISHEIRTPLNGIIGFSKLIAEENVSADNRKSYLEIINYSCKQLIDIVDSILHMAEIETGQADIHLQDLNIEEILEEIISEFSINAHKKNLELLLECDIHEKKKEIITDLQKLRAILSNLINNSLKFTQTGKITVKCTLDDSILEIRVSDTGIGIESWYLNDIFKPFFQVDSGWNRKFRGNGLGLSICRSYAEILDGEITVTSYKGKGSEFTLRLPQQKKGAVHL